MFHFLSVRKLVKEQQARIRELEKKNQEKSEFLSIMAHQLRTPLSATKWAFEMLLSGDFGELTAEQKTVLVKASHSNQRLISMLQEIIAANQADDHALLYHMHDVDVSVCMHQTLNDFKEQALAKGITLTTSGFNQGLLHILGDKEKLCLAMQNIIENGLKYNKPNGTLHVGAMIEQDMIEITIADSGIGIPDASLKKLFTKFYRADNAKGYDKGTGLGLFTAKKIIERHDGTISVSSKENQGTTFTIRLPLKKIKSSV